MTKMSASTTAARVLKRHPPTYRRARRIAALRGRLPPRDVAGVPGRVHRNDFMLYGPDGSYARTGEATARLVLEAASERQAPASWLDFGCGYGRVLRWLTQAVDPATIGCFDVNSEATMFCESEFGATGLTSKAPLHALTLGRWDFVYAISVVTHLPGDEFFNLVQRLITPGGTVLFTTHGQWAVDNIASYGADYARQQERVRADLATDGLSFLPYPYSDGSLGMTWHTHEYVLDRMSGIEFAGYRQAQAPGNHDVYVFRADG